MRAHALSPTRREFLAAAAISVAGGTGFQTRKFAVGAQQAGDRPERPIGVSVLNPRGRVPVSLIIDDSTCLVNLAHFASPQFAEVFPDRYTQDWRELPREIPDSFVERFAAWCAEHNLRGKYSIVPYPACVGWLDRELPGWSRKQLASSLQLVREVIMPAWDIHPEMITHTWAIDTKTGRPFAERTEAFQENWGFSQHKSADELAEYLAYALRVLKNAGLRCEGITTPGGFGSQNRDNLARASLEALRDVFSVEIPHYFRDLFTGDESVEPRVELATRLNAGDDPSCVVSIVGCTGDWFGGWDGLEAGSADQFITEDGAGGRLPQVIARGEPAILVGHWPGFYFNGREHGFRVLQEVVRRLESTYDNLIWMKNSEIARYWAARGLTRFEARPNGQDLHTLFLHAPFACSAFTVRIEKKFEAPPRLVSPETSRPLREVRSPKLLEPNTWLREADENALVVCFDLPKGPSQLDLAAV
jgi:hypothetical protein